MSAPAVKPGRGKAPSLGSGSRTTEADPLQPMPMTPEQVADLLARARANTTPVHIETGRKNRARWDRWRAAQGR